MDKAKQIIREAHDSTNPIIDWRFAEKRDDNWEPFCERFPKKDWMKWDLSPMQKVEEKIIGKVIKQAVIDYEMICIRFTDGTSIEFSLIEQRENYINCSNYAPMVVSTQIYIIFVVVTIKVHA